MTQRSLAQPHHNRIVALAAPQALSADARVHWYLRSGHEKPMQVRVRHGADKQSVAFAGFHRVVCDQPFDEGGSDSGMTPPELMLAALGCWAMHYASEYLKARHLAPAEVKLRVTVENGGRAARLTEIAIEIDAPGLGIRVREGLVRAVETCLLHRTLQDPPNVRISMATQVVEGRSATNPAQLASSRQHT
jgi:putative redox protein